MDPVCLILEFITLVVLLSPVLFCCAHTSATYAEVEQLNPILLVPGLTGSSFDVSEDGGNTWDRIWASLERVLDTETFLHDMSLVYDADTNTFTNTTNELIVPIGFGSTDGVDYLDKVAGRGVIGTDYMEDMIEYFETYGGYQRNVNIRAAPYDWRMATDHPQMENFWVQVQELIEEMYVDAGNMQVVIVAHSYGTTSMSYWLPKMDQEWKDIYIKAYVAIAGPFTGAPLALMAAVSGNNYGYDRLLPLEEIRATLRTYGAIAALLPTEKWGDFVLAVTPAKNYTVYDIPQLLLDCGANDTLSMYYNTRDFENYESPGVWVDCHSGFGLETTATMYYNEGDFDQQPDEIGYVDGDGTVPLTSAEYCRRWQGSIPFNYSTWEGLSHVGLVKDQDVCGHILTNVLFGVAPAI